MKSKKVLVALIVMVVILFVSGVGVAYVALKTDLLKSESQIFLKYGKETIDEIIEFLDDETLNEYFEKKTSNNNENNGNFTLETGMDEKDKLIKDEMLTFYGVTDVVNKKAEQHFDLNYSDKEKFQFSYVKNNDLYALASEEVVNKYIAIENNNLKELVAKLGATSTEMIPDKIEFKDYKANLTEKKLESLKNKYENIIIKQLTKENFSKKENSYILTISDEKLKNICTNTMSELRNESELLDIFETNENAKEYQEAIDTLLDEMEEVNFSEITVEITVEKPENDSATAKLSIMYPNGSTVVDITKLNNEKVKISIREDNIDSLTGQSNIELNKSVVENMYKYSINGEVNGAEVKYDLEIEGIATDSVTEKHSVKIKNTVQLDSIWLIYTNQIKFKDNVNVTELNGENTVILNEYEDSDNLTNLLQLLSEQIAKVSDEKIERVKASANNEEDVGTIVRLIEAINLFFTIPNIDIDVNNFDNFDVIESEI